MSGLVNLRFDGAGTLTFVEDRARRTVRSGEAFAVKPDLAKVLLADPSVVDLAAAQVAAEAAAADAAAEAAEGSGYEAMTVAQLRELADKRGLEVPSGAKKAELVAAHVEADAAPSPDEAPAGEPSSPEPSPAADAAPEAATTGGAITLGDLPASAKVQS